MLAVDTVDLEILPGEVHVVAGDNGAGRSTLMKLLSQVERPDEGTVEIAGEPVLDDPKVKAVLKPSCANPPS